MKRVYRFMLCMICIISLVACGTKSRDTTTQSQSDAAKNSSKESESLSDSTLSEKKAPENEKLTFHFISEDLDGNEVSDAIYEDYSLTLINVITTWCPPCKAEIPELSKLYEEMEPNGVNIISFVVDVRPARKNPVQEGALEEAKKLRDELGVTYPMLIPDENLVNGMLEVSVVPTTYFVDRYGHPVGKSIAGAQDYDGWKSTIEERLAML